MTDFILIFLGIITGFVLFFSFPILKKKQNTIQLPKISIVIPCRNEEKNIALLLECLKNQNYKMHEIICVDDQSEDNTAEVINKYGAKLITIGKRPEDWIGKPWAAQCGAEEATGDVLLFLDADLVLNPDAIETLAEKYIEHGVISVQPYHRMQKPYEQLALFFNLTSVAGTGITLPSPKQIGMFGPIIMISREKYFDMGGHSSVKSCVIEDYQLGINYKKAGLKYKLFIGDKNIAFRMYPNGIKSQIEGFSKNFSKGILSANIFTTIMTVAWITALTATPILLIQSIVMWSVINILNTVALYALIVVPLIINSKKIGNYNIFVVLLYPIALIWFHIIVLYSFIKKIFFRSARWKGRKIKI